MLVYGPKRPFLLRYGSRDTRRVDFLLVDGQSTDTPVLGRHTLEEAQYRMVHSLLGGVYGPSLFCMHLGSFEPPIGSTAPQVEAPSDYRVCSIHSFVLMEHCSFLISLLCSYPSVA